VNRRVVKVIEQIQPIWNPRRIYLGGGNAKHLSVELPAHVTITSNIAGLTGGIELWHDALPAAVAAAACRRRRNDGGWALDVEQEVHDVAVLDDVVLALDAQLAGGLDRGLVPVVLEIVDR